MKSWLWLQTIWLLLFKRYHLIDKICILDFDPVMLSGGFFLHNSDIVIIFCALTSWGSILHVVEWPLEVVDAPLEGVATGARPGLCPGAGLGDGQGGGHCSHKQLHLGVNRASPHLKWWDNWSERHFLRPPPLYFVACQVELLKLFGFCHKDFYLQFWNNETTPLQVDY